METTTAQSTALPPEAFEKLILHGKLRELVAAVKPLTDKERSRLSKTAYTVYSVSRSKWFFGTDSKKHKKLSSKLHALNTKSSFERAQFAVLAVCPLSRVKNTDQWMFRDGLETTLEILQDRNPSWLSEWVDHQLSENDSLISWEFTRGLIDAGLIKKPTHINYVRAMVFYFNTWYTDTKKSPLPSIVDRVCAIPGAIEDIYRIFETETNAFSKHYLESFSTKPENFQTWTTAIEILCEGGQLDRARILDASLKGLDSGFSDQQISGFIKVHNHLKPTREEINNRQSTYIDLLNTRVSRVSDFALKKLSKLERAKQLDANRFLEAVSVVTELPTKGPVQSALKLAKRVIKKHPEHKGSCYPLANKALQHESPDIQELASDLIEQIIDCTDEAQREALIDLVPACSSRVQTRLQAVLNLDAMHQNENEVFNSADFDLIFDRISAIPDAFRQKFGLNETQFLTKYPLPIDFDILETAVLSNVQPLPPIQSLDELIDCISHAVEVVDSADEIERLLDGLSRFCDQKPEDFNIRTAALLKRIKEPRYSETQKELIPGWGRLSVAFQDLLLTWLTGQYHHTPPSFYYEDVASHHIHINRLRELTRRIYKRQAAPLFATPTHKEGWIDPIQLIARLRHLEQDWKYSRRHDLTQALLRIAPDRRQEALALRSNIPAPIRQLVCWAFGAEEGPSSNDRKEYELWVAAGRARCPKGSLVDAYHVFRVKDKLPDSINAARYTWKSTIRHSKSDSRYSFPEIQMSHNQGSFPKNETRKQPNSFPDFRDVQHLLQASFKRLFSLSSGPIWKRIPTTALHLYNKGARYLPFSAWQIQWVQYTWPLHQDSFLNLGIQRIIGRIDENTATSVPLYSYLEPVFHLYRPWTEMTQLAVWTAAVAKDIELQNVAIEALIEAISDGRAHPEPLVKVLLKLAEGGWIKLNRLASALEQVAAVSPLHQYVICTILDQYIAGLPDLPKNAYHILQLQFELHTTLRIPAPPETKIKLKELKGKGKAAQLARSLCDYTDERDVTAIYAASVEGRLSLIDSLIPSTQA
ncbi:MAG: hypothetical protein KTR29_23380 [Rhodothermaceae bacterium]|nr:hypothetical protein [Rhodothermaceae bacterium]